MSLCCELRWIPFAVCLAAAVGVSAGWAAEPGRVGIAVVDQDDKPLPCRIHLKDSAGNPQQAGELPFFRDHFVCPGNVELELAAGKYTFEIERGPEYESHSGSFDLAEAGKKTVRVSLPRIADLAAGGWYSGDLHVHRALQAMPLLMRAEDLHVAPVITWWNNRNQWTDRGVPEDCLVEVDDNRFYHVMAGEDEREGGALMYFGRNRPLAIAGSSREYPSPMKFVAQARSDGPVWIDVEKPFWWDVPIWLASGQIDSVGLANNHMCRSRMYESEAWGRPRDADRLPPPRGNGFWTQEIYYHILNSGLRIPPSAGSASGVLPNPLGYDRVYVHCGDGFGYQKWWDGLKAGRSFVTNGPLLIVKANGQLPGHVFTADEGEQIEIQLGVSLTSRGNVPEIEIIKNGAVDRAVPFNQLYHSAMRPLSEGSLGTLTFRESGWFLVRAIADVEHTFRFASTAPYFVEIGPQKKRISRASAQFFVDWVDERAKRVPLKLDHPEKLPEVLTHHEKAREFWHDVLAKANAE
ncbi:MAG: CehA/McbA family metallohydrolase [Planctomycetota bacterium]|jgi:hypothetical protein